MGGLIAAKACERESFANVRVVLDRTGCNFRSAAEKLSKFNFLADLVETFSDVTFENTKSIEKLSKENRLVVVRSFSKSRGVRDEFFGKGEVGAILGKEFSKSENDEIKEAREELERAGSVNPFIQEDFDEAIRVWKQITNSDQSNIIVNYSHDNSGHNAYLHFSSYDLIDKKLEELSQKRDVVAPIPLSKGHMTFDEIFTNLENTFQREQLNEVMEDLKSQIDRSDSLPVYLGERIVIQLQNSIERIFTPGVKAQFQEAYEKTIEMGHQISDEVRRKVR